MVFSAACSGRKNPDSRLGGERRPSDDRIWEQRRSSLGADAGVAGSRDGRGTSQIRQKAWGLDWGMGRREGDADLKDRGQNRNIKGWWRLCRKALSAALRGLKAQQVRSPGQRPGYHVPIPYAL